MLGEGGVGQGGVGEGGEGREHSHGLQGGCGGPWVAWEDGDGGAGGVLVRVELPALGEKGAELVAVM